VLDSEGKGRKGTFSETPVNQAIEKRKCVEQYRTIILYNLN